MLLIEKLGDVGLADSICPVDIVMSSGDDQCLRFEDAPTLLVTTEGSVLRGVAKDVVKGLRPESVYTISGVRPNPDITEIRLACANLPKINFRQIIALGGGSVIDVAKILTVYLDSAMEVDIEWMVTQSLPLSQDVRNGLVELTVVPTTAGTGSEVTPYATVWDRASTIKHSITGPAMFPARAILDYRHTLTLNFNQTLYPALDAISHALESLWNRNASPASQKHAIDALKLIAGGLPKVLESPSNSRARADVQLGSTIAGLAIAETQTAIAHAISYPITLNYGVPHGLACSFTLPALIRDCYEYFPCSSVVIINQTLRLLESLDLKKRVSTYCSMRDVLNVAGDASSYSRSLNYIHPSGHDNGYVQDIVSRC